MLIATTWKTRPLNPEQVNRMMTVWGKLQAAEAASTVIEPVCQYFYADGSGGFSVARVKDTEAAGGSAFGLEWMMSLSEFLDAKSEIVMELDHALPSIMAAVGHVNGA